VRLGAALQWHYGRVTRLRHFAVAGGKSVTIWWEAGGMTSQQGDLAEAQWDIVRLALLTTGRIALLSDRDEQTWMSDYRFLEAVRSSALSCLGSAPRVMLLLPRAT
jgi:hypothetical protein